MKRKHEDFADCECQTCNIGRKAADVERDDTWMIRANIEQRVAAMYEEALRRIGDTEELSADVMIARQALDRAEQVGHEAQREAIDIPGKLAKVRRDTAAEMRGEIEKMKASAAEAAAHEVRTLMACESRVVELAAALGELVAFHALECVPTCANPGRCGVCEARAVLGRGKR